METSTQQMMFPLVMEIPIIESQFQLDSFSMVIDKVLRIEYLLATISTTHSYIFIQRYTHISRTGVYRTPIAGIGASLGLDFVPFPIFYFILSLIG